MMGAKQNFDLESSYYCMKEMLKLEIVVRMQSVCTI